MPEVITEDYKEPAPYHRGEPNPNESMMIRFDKACELYGLDEGLYNYLKHICEK